MKWWHGLIIGLILGGIAAGVPVYFLSRCNAEPGGQVVVTDSGITGPTEPNKPGEKTNQECGQIWIEGGIIAGNRFGVTAGDGYNHAERVFGLGIITPPKRWHIIQLSYAPVFNLFSKQFRHGVDAMYFYSWEHIAIGAGAMAVFDKTQLYDIGPKIGIQARFGTK